MHHKKKTVPTQFPMPTRQIDWRVINAIRPFGGGVVLLKHSTRLVSFLWCELVGECGIVFFSFLVEL